MNEDDVLTQLRDIHVPADVGTVAPAEFAAWPFIVLAVVIGVILAIRFWTQNRWRRSARTDLARIVGIEDPSTQWSMLLTFASGLSGRAGREITLPHLAYRHPTSITDADRAEFISHLSAELGR